MTYEFSDEYELAFEEAEVNGGGDFTEIPDGIYSVVVDEVELTESSTGYPMFKWQLRILGGDYNKRLLWKNSVITPNPKTMKFLKRDLATCGCYPKSIDDLNDFELLETLLGVELQIKKEKKGEYDNIYFQKRTESTASHESYSDNLPF